MAGLPPLKGTDTIFVSVTTLNTSAANAPEPLGVGQATFR